MLNRRTLIVSSLLGFAMPGAALAARKRVDPPEDTVKGLQALKTYTTLKNQVIGERYFEQRAAAALSRELAKPADRTAINFDPRWGVAEANPQNVRIAPSKKAERLTELVVTFDEGGQRKSVRYELLNTSIGWRILDVRYDNGQTLKGLLKI